MEHWSATHFKTVGGKIEKKAIISINHQLYTSTKEGKENHFNHLKGKLAFDDCLLKHLGSEAVIRCIEVRIVGENSM